MPYVFLSATLVLALAITWSLVKWFRRHSIAQLPGPPSESWLVGNIPAFQRPENAGEADFEWTEKYGQALRTKGCFGEDILFLSDPKALHYVLNKSGYNFPKTYEARARLRLVAGTGIVWAEGAQHSRQRKIMNPGFSHSALKGFLPLFLDAGRKTSNSWKADLFRQGKEKASVVDVAGRLARTTLDIIGQAAFGYNFNSIDNEETELFKSYHNLFADANYLLSDFSIVFRRLVGAAPEWLAQLLSSLPKPDLQRMNHHMEVSRRFARTLVDAEMKAHMDGKEGGKDIMSIFIKANASEDPKRRLDEDEILSQITTLMLAGHETTAKTLSWALFELSKKPDVQRKLRAEIRAMRSQVTTQGGQVTIADLDSMEYMDAVVKETLRYHTISLHLYRRAAHDDVIPLDTPQRTVSGDVINAIPISEGQILQISMAAYNRIKSVWGEDADQWRPERFLDGLGSVPELTMNLGMIGNLASFSSGLRSCSGWRFAMIQMQALLVELIDNFEFSPAPGNPEIRRVAAGIMQSMVKGQESKGAQLPLTVAVAKT